MNRKTRSGEQNHYYTTYHQMVEGNKDSYAVFVKGEDCPRVEGLTFGEMSYHRNKIEQQVRQKKKLCKMLDEDENPVETTCQRCGEVGYHRRYVQISAPTSFKQEGLLVDQLLPSVPFTRVKTSRTMYSVLVCKKCREDWLTAIKKWFHMGNG